VGVRWVACSLVEGDGCKHAAPLHQQCGYEHVRMRPCKELRTDHYGISYKLFAERVVRAGTNTSQRRCDGALLHGIDDALRDRRGARGARERGNWAACTATIATNDATWSGVGPSGRARLVDALKRHKFCYVPRGYVRSAVPRASHHATSVCDAVRLVGSLTLNGR
jgi:hypothetical protein